MTKMCSIVQDANHHCKTQLKEKTFCYTWSIDHFWKIYKLQATLQSSIAENNLQIRMYPEVDKLRFYGYYIKSESKNSPSSTKFYSLYSIFLKSTEGKVCKIRNEMCSIEKGSSGILYDLPISYLISNQRKYLLNGTLTIYFEFNIISGMINNSINHEKHEILPITNMDSFVSDKISDTVTFVVNKKQILQANKNLLCLKSKVFKAMFDCDLKESKTNEIEITDIKYDILKELLSFIVTDNLSNHIKRNAEAICELCIAAEKYDIEDLKLICEQNIIKITTIENVVEYLKFAYLNNATVLTKYAKDFIKLYLKDIVDTPNFIILMQEYPELLIQIKNIQLSVTNARTITQ